MLLMILILILRLEILSYWYWYWYWDLKFFLIDTDTDIETTEYHDTETISRVSSVPVTRCYITGFLFRHFLEGDCGQNLRQAELFSQIWLELFQILELFWKLLMLNEFFVIRHQFFSAYSSHFCKFWAFPVKIP